MLLSSGVKQEWHKTASISIIYIVTFYLLSFDFVPLSLPVVVYKAPWWGTRWPYLETASIVSRANCLYLGGIIKIAQHKASIPFIVIRIVTCGPQGRISLQKNMMKIVVSKVFIDECVFQRHCRDVDETVPKFCFTSRRVEYLSQRHVVYIDH